MNVALDTNAYSDFLRGVPVRVEIVRRASRIFIPIIVLGELRAGFAAGSREEANLATLRQFLASPRRSRTGSGFRVWGEAVNGLGFSSYRSLLHFLRNPALPPRILRATLRL